MGRKDGKSVSGMNAFRNHNNVPVKDCVVCGKPFTWRKKWEKCWDEVLTCSHRCKTERRGQNSSGRSAAGLAAGAAVAGARGKGRKGAKCDESDDDEGDTSGSETEAPPPPQVKLETSCEDSALDVEASAHSSESVEVHSKDTTHESLHEASEVNVRPTSQRRAQKQAAKAKRRAHRCEAAEQIQSDESDASKLDAEVSAGCGELAATAKGDSGNDSSNETSTGRMNSSASRLAKKQSGKSKRQAQKCSTAGMETPKQKEFGESEGLMLQDEGLTHLAEIVAAQDVAEEGSCDEPNSTQTGLEMSRSARKQAAKEVKAKRRAQRSGAPGTEAAKQKKCDECQRYVDLLIRCTIDVSQEWHMLCGRCWKVASGGVPDGDADHPHYRYGGLWKNRAATVSTPSFPGQQCETAEAR